MAGKANELAPIIIKKKKIVKGGGHHGGAWKVAYADFVTAMMAFFLLMWLLGATTEKQRKGIADFFNPSVPVNRVSGGGSGAFGGDSIFSEETDAQNGTGAGLKVPTDLSQARGSDVPSHEDGADHSTAQGRAGDDALEEIAELLKGAAGESMVSELMARHIVSRLTDEGLIVELFSLPGEPIFLDDGAEPTELLADLVDAVAEVFALVGNDVAVSGHVRARPVVVADNPTWDRSVARAGAARELVEDAGIEARRIVRVTGHADRKPADEDPVAIRNDRIELILLRDRI